MNQYPEKTCEIDRLIRQPKAIEVAKNGIKTQQRRDGIYGYPGEAFILDGVRFVMTALERKSLGDMTDSDAQAEGYSNLDAYKEVIIKMHPGMTWTPEALVWVHYFRKDT